MAQLCDDAYINDLKWGRGALDWGPLSGSRMRSLKDLMEEPETCSGSTILNVTLPYQGHGAHDGMMDVVLQGVSHLDRDMAV